MPSNTRGDDAEQDSTAGHDDDKCDGEDGGVDNDGPVAVRCLMAVLGGSAAGCDG